ncbi:MAG: DUF4832 domain-containing protein [Truepera sp.]|nr:DUF4832 domain-containing protein [Truepera sp.]
MKPNNRSLGRVAIDKHSTQLRFYLLLIISILLLAACSRTLDAPPNIPPPAPAWQSDDVGQVGIPGDTDFINQQHAVVRGSGEDIWGSADSFHFAYQPLRGDSAITARVVSIDNTHQWAKAGVMIREQLTPNSKHALVALTPLGIVEFNWRPETGGLTSNSGNRQVGVSPRWVRLVRQGNTFSSYESADGVAWQLVASTEIVMAEQVYVGLAVTSRSNSQIALGELEQINVQALPDTDPDPDPDPNPEPMIRVAYDPDYSDFPNPERGFYSYINLLTGRDFSGLAAQGLTLGHAYVRLDNYRYQPLPEHLLTNLRQGFAAARSAGIKVILRFSYNFGFVSDAPLNNVLQHIDQLAPLLRENQDVIAVLQAGFIGAWGEWHGSTYGLTALASREAITNALLQALPPSRMIQIRYPRYVRDLHPTPLRSDQAFTISNQARTGHHNDCLLTNASDAGTYLSEQDRWYAEQISQFTVIGGETCDLGGLSERNHCSNFLAELDRFNWDYLNHEFWRPLIDQLRAQGCYPEIRQRLGYRLRLIEAAISRQTSQGGSLSLELRMTNDGFGKVYNPRPMEVVLRHTGTRSEHVIRLTDDARTLLPLSGETRHLAFNVALPNSVAVGSYEVFLRLPDPAPLLNPRAQYSIRLANAGTWEASSGYNALRLTVAVTP